MLEEGRFRLTVFDGLQKIEDACGSRRAGFALRDDILVEYDVIKYLTQPGNPITLPKARELASKILEF